MDAVIYARISRDVAGEGLGVQRQVEDCNRKAKSLGWTVVRQYVDNDISASKNRPRPEYAQMLADIEAGKVGAVVVYDLDRLTRRPAELEAFIDLTEAHRVALANVSGDVDLTTANGKMIARIKGAVARQEADRISERTARQKQQRAESGKPLGTRFRVFGYSRNWEVLEDEAEIVTEVFERAARGETRSSITDDLVARGVCTATGGVWRPLNTSRMLRYAPYAGLATYKGQIVGKSEVPAIVSEAVFQAVQSPSPAAKHGNARKYLLSGFAVCGACLTPMSGSSGRYRCDKAMGGCGKVGMRADWVDEPISNRVLGYHQQTRQREPVKVVDHQAEVDAADVEIEALQAAYACGDLALEDLVPALRIARQKRLQALEQASETVSETVGQILRGMDEWTGADLGERRAILTRYLKHVIIHPSGKGRQPQKGLLRLEVHWINGVVEKPLQPMSVYMSWQ